MIRQNVAVTLCLPLILACAPRGESAPDSTGSTPSSEVAGLLAADRAFAAAAAQTDLITALSGMFAADVIMPAPGERLATGVADVVEVLRSNADNTGSRIEWTPIRGGISGDAQHGFTYGYTTVTRADGTKVPGKYVAYWVKGADGWRVSVYTRKPRAEGTVSLAERPPSLPPRLVAPGDEAARARFAEEVAETERSFSRDAQTMGLGPAFVRYSAPDAMNAGGPDDAEFIFGPEAIGQRVGSGISDGTTITWGPDSVRAASSGDLGVTMGLITITSAPRGTRRVPFFTVWKREGTGHPWRFVAE